MLVSFPLKVRAGTNPEKTKMQKKAGINKDELRYWIRELGYDVTMLPKLSAYKLQMPIAFENVVKKMSTEEREMTDRFIQTQSGKKIWKITEFYNELLFRVPALEQAVRHKGKSYNYSTAAASLFQWLLCESGLQCSIHLKK